MDDRFHASLRSSNEDLVREACIGFFRRDRFKRAFLGRETHVTCHARPSPSCTSERRRSTLSPNFVSGEVCQVDIC
ncbi:MAG TPA: hypothetical protein DDX19_06680 [Rhodopirellula baltica]|nr:hypothetical protein [Rhodopirellula baltica]